MPDNTLTALREGDVVRYTPERTWCRDGLAIAVTRHNGRVVLCETYWASQGDDSVVAPQSYELLFNLADYDEVQRYDWDSYAPADRHALMTHHGHRTRFFVRKGATESHDQKVAVARQRVTEAEERLRSAQRGLECRRRDLDELLGGRWFPPDPRDAAGDEEDES